MMDFAKQLIQVEIKKRQRPFFNELNRKGRELQKSGNHPLESSTGRKIICNIFTKELENRASIIWESLQRTHKALGSQITETLACDLKKAATQFLSEITKELSEFMMKQPGLTKDDIAKKPTLDSTKNDACEKIDMKVDLYVNSLTNKPARTEPETEKNIFRNDGDKWTVAFNHSEPCYLKNIKGMSYIARLLDKPNESISALNLANPKSDTKLMIQGKVAENEMVSSDSGEPQEMIDEDALYSYQKRLTDIKSELADAEKKNDQAKQVQLNKEKEGILNQLKNTTFKRKISKFSNDKEKARTAVTNAINRALNNIKKHNQPLYQHLDNSILCGSGFTYTPDKEINWEL